MQAGRSAKMAEIVNAPINVCRRLFSGHVGLHSVLRNEVIGIHCLICVMISPESGHTVMHEAGIPSFEKGESILHANIC